MLYFFARIQYMNDTDERTIKESVADVKFVNFEKDSLL